ncbi:MAG: PEP-CTERM sorting domain-containing protein [Kiritimatiellia bacterium]
MDPGTLTGVTQSDQGGSVSFNSSALDTFLKNDNNNTATFLVRNINGTGSFNGFYAKEHSNSGGTTLTVIPEPSTVILVGLGLIAALGLSRKRSV